MSYYQKHIFVCTNQKASGKQCCANSGGNECFEHLKMKLLENKIHGAGKIRVSKSGCLGRCKSGPCLVVYPDGIWYSYSSFHDIDEIIDSHLLNGKPVERLFIDKE